MDKAFEWIFRNFGKIWILSVVLWLTVVGVVLWAIIALVNHFTG